MANEFVKVVLRAALSVFSFTYDLISFLRSGGARKARLSEGRQDYLIAMMSHSLEKSMAYSVQRPGAGESVAVELAKQISLAKQTDALAGSGSGRRFHLVNATNVLSHYFEKNSRNLDELSAKLIEEAVVGLKERQNTGGAKVVSLAASAKGRLTRPEDFFMSRSTVREFSDMKVEREDILRAVLLAMKTPTACDRQPWRVYQAFDRELIDDCLSLQVGNSGFGHQIPVLLVVSVDQAAFFGGHERNQCWVEGGLFSMGLVMALHSLGLASCCLNWCADPFRDLKIHRRLQIEPNSRIIMMIGVGWPKQHTSVCCSVRRPVSDVLIDLERK